MMTLTRRALLLGACLAPLPLWSASRRVVVLGGSIAEIVADLGAEALLVGRDTTTTYPARLTALPDVGYVRALNAEGVLSLAPDLILAEPDAGPPPVIEVLKAAGTRFVTIPSAPDAEGVLAKIAAVAEALSLPHDALTARVRAELDQAAAAAAKVAQPQSVLFVLSLQGGVMAGGAGTSAEGIIRLAGGVNAAKGFSGFKPMTDEAVLAADPQVILVMDREGAQSITPEMITAHPALGRTSAASAGRILSMDGMFLLGFGPRTGAAALALNAALYG